MGILENLSKEELTNIVKIFDIQIAIVIVLVVFVTKSIFARIVIDIFYKIQKRKANPKESSMYNTIRWMYVFLGLFLASKILPLTGEVSVIVNTFFKIIFIIFVTQTINNMIFVKDSIIFRKNKEKAISDTISGFVFRICRILTWCVAVYIIFYVLGFDLSGLITGLGIGTVLISLAAQDTVKSLLSGFTILTDKPFVVGDWIEVSTYQGTVIDITFRSTRIKSYDNTVITIPNSTITSTYVINWNRLTSRRFDCTLHLGLDTPSEKIRKFIREIRLVLENNPMVIKETVQVSLHEITMASCEIKIFLYVREADYNRFLDIKEELLCSMLFVAEKENIELASPRQNVYLRGKEEDKE